MIKGNKFISLALVMIFLLSMNTLQVFAESENNNEGYIQMEKIVPALKTKIIAYVRPDFCVQKDGEYIEFFDEAGERVAPLMYNSVAYLPVRAIAGLMAEPVEWVAEASTIFIGNTLSNPSKSLIKPESSPFVKSTQTKATGTPSAAKAYIRTNILIMYDFQTIEFKDELGNVIYPLICGGTTYLPINAISQLMDDTVTIDKKEKIITIGTSAKSQKPLDKLSQQTQDIIELYERQSALYNAATSTIIMINGATKEELLLLKKEIASDYLLAQSYNANMRDIVSKMYKERKYTATEIYALKNLGDFAEYCEHYILVMENMIYLADEGKDYGMFEEIFSNFVYMTQEAMSQSANAIERLMLR